jgi:putative ABC transport system permease protein
MNFELIEAGLVQGLILGIIAFGLMIPFRFLNFPDLSGEGAYPLGGAICATAIVAGYTPLFAVVLAAVSGGALSVFAAQIAQKLKVNSLLAGIIASTMAYSLILRIMGRPSIAILGMPTFELYWFDLLAILLACVIPFACFLQTDFGLRFRVVGHNRYVARNYGLNIPAYTNLGCFIAGAHFGLAGALIAQIQKFVDVGMGGGIVIHGLASLMVGECLIGSSSLKKQLLGPIIGALAYQQIQGLALSLGLAPSDLRFFTGFIVIILLSLTQDSRQEQK